MNMMTRVITNDRDVTKKASAALLLVNALFILSSCGTSSVETSEPLAGDGSSTPGVWQEEWQERTMYEVAFPLEEETVFDADPERIVLAPWVSVLDPSKQQAISSVEEHRVIFDAAGNEDLLALEPMQIVSSIREDAIFLRRVIATEQQGDKIIVHTTEASITEAIVSGSFDLGSAPTGMMNPSGDVRQQALSGYAKEQPFQAMFDSKGFRVEAELPLNGNYSITPNFAVNVEEELEAKFAFQADIDMAGSRRMCEDLVEASDPVFRRSFPWFGEVQKYPAELLQLAWALEWAGNTRTGRAGDIDFYYLGLGGSTIATYHGTNISVSPFGIVTEEPINYVQMRPEFIEATNKFSDHVRERQLTRFFDMTGPYARVQGGATRREILDKYKEMRSKLRGEPLEMLNTYIAVLERQSDLDWLNTALIVARHHCQGVTKNSRGKSSVKTTIGVEGGFKIKRANNVGVSDEAITSKGFTKNSTTGTFRKNLFEYEHPIKVFWIGWFPVVIRPVFQIGFIFKAPEVSAEYDFHYGPYQIIMEGGYNRGSNGTVPEGSMTQSPTCTESNAGLCGGLSSKTDTSTGAGNMTFIARTGSVSLETEAQVVPEFIARFYEVASVGVGVPVYGNVKASIVGRAEGNTSQGAIARGNICVGAKAGLKINLFGRLNDPFSARSGPDAQIQTNLYDSCASESFIPCAKASVGLSAGVSGGNPAYVNPTYNWGDDRCPQDRLEIRLQWNEQTDLDLTGVEPSGDQLSYRTNVTTRNDGNHTSGAACKDDNGQPVTNCSAEFLEWGKSIGAVTPGTYQFWVTNEDGAAASNATVQVIRTRAAGGDPEIQTFNVNLPAERNAESQRFSVEID